MNIENDTDVRTELSGTIKLPLKKKNAKREPENGNLIYLGPTITGAARHGTVFKDGILPKNTQEFIAEFPQMIRLFVEVDKMPEAVMEIRKKQGVLGAIYDQVEAHFMRRSL